MRLPAYGMLGLFLGVTLVGTSIWSRTTPSSVSVGAAAAALLGVVAWGIPDIVPSSPGENVSTTAIMGTGLYLAVGLYGLLYSFRLANLS